MGLKNSIVRLLARSVGVQKTYRVVYHLRRLELSARLAADYGNRVQHGPFTGMTLPAQSAWGKGDRGAKLLGLYEAELHPALRRACDRLPETVINVGCAEGFYAVGLARVLPQARVFAFDIDARARSVCAAAAAENGVADRVTLRGEATCETLAQLAGSASSVLLVMDCEGCEATLLDPERVPVLGRCDIIVETHECFVPQVTETLKRRLRATHAVEEIRAGARDPAAVLPHWPETDRWLIVNEGRPAGMAWLACWRLQAERSGHSRSMRGSARAP